MIQKWFNDVQCDFCFPVNKGDLEKGAHLEGQLCFGDTRISII